MIPLVNSTHGMVIETYDLLRSERVPRDFSIIGDTTIKIEHCLVVSGLEGSAISFDDAQQWTPATRPPQLQRERISSKVLTLCTVMSKLWVNVQAGSSEMSRTLNEWQLRAQRRPLKCSSSRLFTTLLLQIRTQTPSVYEPLSLPRSACAYIQNYSWFRRVYKMIKVRLVCTIMPNCTRSHGLWLVNQTRFILLSKSSSPPPTLAALPLQSKAIIRIPVTHSSGSFRALLPLDRILQAATSTTDPPLIERVERRPSIYGGAWDDIYFVGLEERPENRLDPLQAGTNSRWEPKVQDVCVRIREIGGTVDILGTW
jgi:hypothetical protein